MDEMEDSGEIAMFVMDQTALHIENDTCDGVCIIALCTNGNLGFCATDPNRKQEMIERLELVVHNLKTNKNVTLEQANAQIQGVGESKQ